MLLRDLLGSSVSSSLPLLLWLEPLLLLWEERLSLVHSAVDSMVFSFLLQLNAGMRYYLAKIKIPEVIDPEGDVQNHPPLVQADFSLAKVLVKLINSGFTLL